MEVGIDIEKMGRVKDMHSIAKNFFSEKEKNAVMQADGSNAGQRVFYAIWTRKEAFVKALGNGLAYPLKSFSVDTDFSHEEGPVEVDAEKSNQWKTISFPMEEPYIGALAVENRPAHMEFFNWSTPGA